MTEAKTKTIHAKVEVWAGAGKESVEKLGVGKFRIWVREEARNNMANKRVLKIMSDMYGASTGRVRIVKGHRSPKKMIEINVG